MATVIVCECTLLTFDGRVGPWDYWYLVVYQTLCGALRKFIVRTFREADETNNRLKLLAQITEVYVIKRPWVDQFMAAMGEVYEVVVFTASLAKYADPLLDLLDPKSLVRLRLFRDSCCPYEGNYVKDLSRLGRELRDTIIIDNSPHSYVFQPENAIGCGTFIDDPKDRDLLDLIPFLLSIKEHEDVRDFLARRFNGDGSWR